MYVYVVLLAVDRGDIELVVLHAYVCFFAP